MPVPAKVKIGTVTVSLTAFGAKAAGPRPTRKPRPGERITTGQWTAYTAAFDYFNAELFGGSLPPVVLNFSRHANCYGFFAPNRWQQDGEPEQEGEAGGFVAHEISLNPSHLASRDLRATFSTLVHEMVHLWQEDKGKKKSKRGYHNGEWADAMDRVGLTPTSTGLPGGARVGYKVTHMVVDGGPYDRAFQAMPDECKLPWLCREPDAPERKKAKRSKVKYTCPGCEFNAWAKPEAKVKCGDCDLDMEAEELDDEDTDAAAETITARAAIADRGAR